MAETTPDSKRFAEDVANAVCDYCADGVDAFLLCLNGAPLLDDHVVKEIHVGTELLGQDLLAHMDSNLVLFEQLCRTTVFNAPPLALAVTAYDKAAPSPAMARTPGRSEADLDIRLAGLRADLARAGAEARALQADVQRMDQDVRAHGHIASHTAALAVTLDLPRGGTPGKASGGGGGQDQAAPPPAAVPGVATSIAAIAASVQRLQPLLAKASALRAKRAPSSMQVDPSVAVEFKAAQLAKACGGADDLAAVQAMLGGANATMEA
ncbi:hypothetical protein FOA52_007370 [Chlamydomonas sp. UWO 241]|nr:hypothetical protein FOA52_007370 [Chlamydomonas sp. UWO 241]